MAKGVTHVSATSVHCALAIWTTQGHVFLRRADEGEGLTLQPQGSYQMAKSLFSLDDSEQPRRPRKGDLISSSAPSFSPFLVRRQLGLPLTG